MPVSERLADGPLFIKVDLGEAQVGSAGAYVGVLFLSVPHVGGDPDLLTRLMAHVRKGFESGVISLGSFRVTLGADQQFESFHDDEAGTVLLNLPATLTIEAAG